MTPLAVECGRLHLGCGLNAPKGWINVDGSIQAVFARWPLLKALLVSVGVYPEKQAKIPWPRNVLRKDLRKPLDFPNDYFEAVYSSHTFEHLYRAEAMNLARECYRVLHPGGICRIVVPDLQSAVGRYIDEQSDHAADDFVEALLFCPPSPQRGLLGIFHRIMGFHSHKWMYDGASLAALMSSAGFSNVLVYHSVQGKLPGLLEIEDRSRIENGAGVAVEGIKQ